MNRKRLDWLYSLESKGINLGLERVSKLASLLNNPQDKFLSIHIAGTNGKGSIAKMLYTILREQGYSVALYTSPHLVRFNERIIVGDKEISDEDIARLMENTKKIVEDNNIDATFFEFITIMAFLYFEEKRVDIAIIETGMGGRLDATNIIKPIVSIISKISLEHQDYLGESIEKIAFEKAGIIKQGIDVITDNDGEALEVIRKACKEKNADLAVVKEKSQIKIIESLLEHQKAIIKTDNDSYHIKTKLLGEYQLTNAATAILACETINNKIKIDTQSIINGINKTFWPARLEIIRKEPLIILDGSHTPEGFTHLKEFLLKHVKNPRTKVRGVLEHTRNSSTTVRAKARSLRAGISQCIKDKFKRIIMVLGIAEDKDKKAMISLIVYIADKIILCKAEYKGTPTKELKSIAEEYNKNIEEISKVSEAYNKALEEANKDDVVIVTGSLYVAGEVMTGLDN